MVATWEAERFQAILNEMEARAPHIIRSIYTDPSLTMRRDRTFKNYNELADCLRASIEKIVTLCTSNDEVDLLKILLNLSPSSGESTPSGAIVETDTRGTLLHIAAKVGDLEMTKLLIAYGAEKNAKVFHGSLFKECTPLDIASIYSHTKIVHFFLFQVKGTQGNFQNILCSSAYHADIDVIQWLLDHKKIEDINKCGVARNQETLLPPISWAMRNITRSPANKQKGLLLLLLRHDALVNIQVKKSSSINFPIAKHPNPLHVISRYYYFLMITRPSRLSQFVIVAGLLRLLLISGANPKLKCPQIGTPERKAPIIIPIVTEINKYRYRIAKKYQFFTKDEKGEFTDQIDDASVRELGVLIPAYRASYQGFRYGYIKESDNSAYAKFFKQILGLPEELFREICSVLFFPPLGTHTFPARVVKEPLPSAISPSIKPLCV